MHPRSRQELLQRLEACAREGSSAFMVIMRPVGTSEGSVVVKEADGLRLCYVQEGPMDFWRPYRCWLHGLRFGLKPRLGHWGKERVISLSLGTDLRAATMIVERFYNDFFRRPSPFALEFQNWGWTSLASNTD